MILICGASGNIGRRTAAILAEHGRSLRLLLRDPARAPRLAGAEVVAGDYADPASLDRAFAGIATALIVSGYAEPGKRAQLHGNAIDAARRAGVAHLVYLSFQGAAPDSKFPMARDHHFAELLLEASGIPYASLRDNLYLDILPEMFGREGVVRGPAADGAAAFVSRDDVARVAAAALSRPDVVRGAVEVTGPEALTLSEAARRLSALAGRELRYENESVEAGRVWRAQLGAPVWEVDTWLGSYEAIAAGELAATSDAVARFTGRPPESLESYFARRPELLAPLRA
jgi:uncharacterized protein YbjT (DUF2867 family)